MKFKDPYTIKPHPFEGGHYEIYRGRKLVYAVSLERGAKEDAIQTHLMLLKEYCAGAIYAKNLMVKELTT